MHLNYSNYNRFHFSRFLYYFTDGVVKPKRGEQESDIGESVKLVIESQNLWYRLIIYHHYRYKTYYFVMIRFYHFLHFRNS